MSSTTEPDLIFVWTWLPGSPEPVVAGAVERVGADRWIFGYTSSYLARAEAISLYGPELPLREGWQEPIDPLRLAACLRDALPDAWGQRVIDRRIASRTGDPIPDWGHSMATYMRESGSNRFGAVDFQESPSMYLPREDTGALEDLVAAAADVEAGQWLRGPMADALVHGTSIGGARPKVLIDADGRQCIAKLAVSADPYPVIRSEMASIVMARAVGIPVPSAELLSVRGRDVLLVDRFDRPGGGIRRHVVSGLTVMGLDEISAIREASYPALLDELMTHAADPGGLGSAVFDRIAFNMAISNTDDHARNHAAFWDGENLSLTPAFDLSPVMRSGETASQAMPYDREGRRNSVLADLISSAHVYGIPARAAQERVEEMLFLIEDSWQQAADEARLTAAERAGLWGRLFVNPGTVRDVRVVSAPGFTPRAPSEPTESLE